MKKCEKVNALLEAAEARMDLWAEIASDPVALEDRDKTKEEAKVLASYFEGKVDVLYAVTSILRK